MRPVPPTSLLARPLEALLAPLGARLVPLSILAGLTASAALGAGIAYALPGDPSDILTEAEVKPGMKGYGLTVMSGTTPEKFDIEVVSTLHNFRANMDLFIIKTPHPRLNVTRTVAGMSGSPIFINGKMIGAYAYGWLFGVEPIAGVTPIRSMLNEMARPVPRGLFPAGGSPVSSASGADQASLAPGRRSAHAFLGAPNAYDLVQHSKQLAARSSASLTSPDGTAMARASTPILLGGMGAASLKIASNLLTPLGLDPLQAGGASKKQDPEAPTKYVNGGAIGVELSRGDISAMGLGTVTRVDGDKLVAFGHPMLGGGIEALPTAIGKVHWILASQNRSFKIGEAVRPLGALVNDRQAAIVVDASVKAPVFPLHLEVQGVPGAPKTTWDVEVAHDQFMAPMFAAMAIGSALEDTTAERNDMTWRAHARVKVAKRGSLDIYDFATGNGNPIGPDDFTRSRLAKALGQLLNNPWEPVTIERVDVTVKVSFAREVLMLRGAKVLDPELEPGQPVRIRLDLQPYQGKLESRVIEVRVPRELTGQDVNVDLAPGFEVDRPLPTPDNVGDLMANIQAISFDPESVVATVRLKESGAAWRGKVATRLPAFAVDALRPTSQSDAPEVFAAQLQTAIPLKRFMIGHDSVHVTIRPALR